MRKFTGRTACCVFFVLSACAKAQEEISISITNKETLTAEWIEEGERRTVELSITPDLYSTNNSEDSAAFSAFKIS